MENYAPFNQEDYLHSKDPKNQPEDQEQWNMNLENGILSAEQLEKLDVLDRPYLIEPWAKLGDLGFIFAARGVGKTWLGIHLAHCLAANKDFGPWKVPTCEHRILYMDGEMSLADIKYRNHLLGAGSSKLFYLNHERLFELTQAVLNLSYCALQAAILTFCVTHQFGVLILDNLSCLVSGVDENSAIEWEKILPWLLQLRRNKITVIFIHHAGREGLYLRGHSKREDPAAWIMQLKLPKNDPDHEIEGACFISSFAKYRNAPQRPNDIMWNFHPLDNAKEIIVSHERCDLYDIFLELVAHGNHQCKIIADEMVISQVNVSRLAQKAAQNGDIEIKDRKYYIKSSGTKGYMPYKD